MVEHERASVAQCCWRQQKGWSHKAKACEWALCSSGLHSCLSHTTQWEKIGSCVQSNELVNLLFVLWWGTFSWCKPCQLSLSLVSHRDVYLHARIRRLAVIIVIGVHVYTRSDLGGLSQIILTAPRSYVNLTYFQVFSIIPFSFECHPSVWRVQDHTWLFSIITVVSYISLSRVFLNCLF